MKVRWAVLWLGLVSLLLVSCTSSNDGEEEGLKDPTFIEALEASGRTRPEMWVEDPVGGGVSFVAPMFDTGGLGPVAAAGLYFSTFSDLYGVGDLAERLVVDSVTPTRAGTVVRFNQTLGGLPLFNGEITVSVAADGTVETVGGVLLSDSDVPEPLITAEEAVALAVTVAPDVVADMETLRLVAYSPILDGEEGNPIPAWVVEVFDPDGFGEEDQRVVVSGLHRLILTQESLVHTDRSWDVYDSQNESKSYGPDHEQPRYQRAVLMYETRGDVSRGTLGVADATDLNSNMTVVWDYFHRTHGRDSYDDLGSHCNLYVRVGVGYNNAWSSAKRGGCTMAFGDGQPYASSLDVVTHEFGHAVVRTTAGLVYKDQSGALNEHYADFFAAMVDTSDWRIDLVARSFPHPRVPTVADYVVTTSDHGGVHTNSELGNVVSWLVANPGANVHPTNGQVVNGIGREKTEQIWYGALIRLRPKTEYGDWACQVISLARRMRWSDDLTKEDVRSVEDAMLAVGLGVFSPDRTRPSVGPIKLCVVRDRDDDGEAGNGPILGPGTGTDSCELVGSWRLRDQEFLDQLSALAGEDVGLQYWDGDYMVHLHSDGRMVSVRDPWAIAMSAEGLGGIVFYQWSEERGRWSVSGTTLNLQIDQPGTTRSTVYLNVGGQLQEVPFSGLAPPVSGETFAGAVPYTCVDGILSFTVVEDGVAVTSRFDRAR